MQGQALGFAHDRGEPTATIAGGAVTCQSGSVGVGGWAKPVNGTFTSGFHTPERPGHDGVDVAAPKGTPIYAAGSGVVISAICSSSNCDIDGSLSMGGCGWEVTILHGDKSSTRYCHMLRKPYVTAGTPVAAGQQIGVVGTSGNSSGPHLHFETHQPRGTPVEPFQFMANRGVDLGK